MNSNGFLKRALALMTGIFAMAAQALQSFANFSTIMQRSPTATTHIVSHNAHKPLPRTNRKRLRPHIAHSY